MDWLLRSNEFTPHGFCLLWDPEVFWLHLFSDAFIALAYLSIPAALILIAVRRPDLNPFKVLFWFAAFIVTCALTHIFGIVTLWEPVYALSGTTKGVTAVVSVLTASLMWMLLPRALALPSHSALERANAELTSLQQTLESKVAQRTGDLVDANEQLLAARLASDRQVAASTHIMRTVSHELRTPLNAVLGFCQLLQMSASERLSAREREYLEHIGQAGGLLLDLVDDVLDFQRSQAEAEVLEPEPVALSEVVEEARVLLSPILEAKAMLFEAAVPEDLQVMADRRALLQILNNLLSNATKYTPEGGRLGVAVTPGTRAPCLTVWDTGHGIAEADQRQIFTPFFRAEATATMAHGSGLGLPTVQRLTEAHGWRLDLESAPGEGTRMHIEMLEPPERAADLQRTG
jgi:signal transduction histidine kinase